MKWTEKIAELDKRIAIEETDFDEHIEKIKAASSGGSAIHTLISQVFELARMGFTLAELSKLRCERLETMIMQDRAIMQKFVHLSPDAYQGEADDDKDTDEEVS